MNINQLKAFTEVVEAGSFSAAARRLDLSQPAVSLQIQSLEEILGVQLVDRRTRKVTLTEAGNFFYPTAVEILDKLTKAERRLQEIGGVVKGRLAVGGSTTPGQYILPKILSKFRDAFPDVLVTLKIADTGAIEEGVLGGDLSAGLVGARPKAQLNSRKFVDDEVVALVPAGGPDKLDVDSLKRQSFILREKGSGTRRVIEDFLDSKSLRFEDLNVTMELGSTEAVVKAVEAGLGISFVSKWAAEDALRLKRVKVAALEGTPIVRTIYLITGKRAPTRMAEAFLEFIKALDVESIKP
ncbi:MAG: selenium metabolism-associated LysR family transcriptional regulator [Candidatus Aquicultorales bacterium]